MPLSAQTIVTYALQIAKAPGYTAQAGDILNQVLRNLARTQDLDIIRRTVLFPLTPGQANNSYPLPTDYNRVKSFNYYINGVPQDPDQWAYEEYLATYQTTGGLTAPGPVKYAIDDSQIDSGGLAQFLPYPAVQGIVNGVLVYYSTPADIVTPSTSSALPWFPNSMYLYTKVAAELCKLTGDDRVESMTKAADDLLRPELAMINDDEGFARTVSLDPNVFRGRGAGKNTKAIPF